MSDKKETQIDGKAESKPATVEVVATAKSNEGKEEKKTKPYKPGKGKDSTETHVPHVAHPDSSTFIYPVGIVSAGRVAGAHRCTNNTEEGLKWQLMLRAGVRPSWEMQSSATVQHNLSVDRVNPFQLLLRVCRLLSLTHTPHQIDCVNTIMFAHTRGFSSKETTPDGLVINMRQFEKMSDEEINLILLLMCDWESLIFIGSSGIPQQFFDEIKPTPFVFAGADTRRMEEFVVSAPCGIIRNSIAYQNAVSKIYDRVMYRISEVSPQFANVAFTHLLLGIGMSSFFSTLLVDIDGGSAWKHFFGYGVTREDDSTTNRILSGIIHANLNPGPVAPRRGIAYLLGSAMARCQVYAIGMGVDATYAAPAPSITNMQDHVLHTAIQDSMGIHNGHVFFTNSPLPLIYPDDKGMQDLHVEVGGRGLTVHFSRDSSNALAQFNLVSAVCMNGTVTVGGHRYDDHYTARSLRIISNGDSGPAIGTFTTRVVNPFCAYPIIVGSLEGSDVTFRTTLEDYNRGIGDVLTRQISGQPSGGLRRGKEFVVVLNDFIQKVDEQRRSSYNKMAGVRGIAS